PPLPWKAGSSSSRATRSRYGRNASITWPSASREPARAAARSAGTSCGDAAMPLPSKLQILGECTRGRSFFGAGPGDPPGAPAGGDFTEWANDRPAFLAWRNRAPTGPATDPVFQLALRVFGTIRSP